MILLCSSCYNSRQLGYFQDLSDTSKLHKLATLPREPLRLQADDQVQINISSISPEASQFFNLLQSSPNSGIGTNNGQGFQNIYTVTQEGVISLPVLGDIKVSNITTEALRLRIRDMLKDYLKEAVVTVKLTNFRVTVIGEVGHPNVVPVQGERINIIEALGASGDLTVFAKRNNVKVIRRKGDSLDVAHLNLNDSRSIQSPFFQLQQNDLVYVEPNKGRGLSGETWTIITPIITSILTLLVIIVSNLLR